MSKKNVKYMLNILFLVLIIAGTFYLLLRNQEIGVIIDQIKATKKGFLLGGIGLLVIYVCSESVIICQLLRVMKHPLHFGKCILISCVGFFFSAITPGASGGQPVQVYYLTQCKLDLFVGTLVLMIVTVIFKMTLLLLAIAFAVIEPGAFWGSVSKVPLFFIYGVLGNLLFLLFLMIVIFKPKLATFLVNWGIGVLNKLRIVKHTERLQNKAVESMNQYTQAALYVREHLNLFPRLLFITVIQRLAYFTVAYMVYRSFGLTGVSYTTIITLQIVLSLSVDVLPLPGAAGANENVFMRLYKAIFGVAVVPGLLLCRGITYYVLLIMTAAVTCFAHFYFMRQKKRMAEV